MKSAGRVIIRMIQYETLIVTTNCWTISKITNRNVAKIRDTRSMLLPIASFSWARLAKVFSPVLYDMKTRAN